MDHTTFYRVSRGPFRFDLSGKGAELLGGRWNPAGVPAVYAADSISLALLETLVHAKMLPSDHFIMTLSVPMAAVRPLSVAALPAGWNQTSDQCVARQVGMTTLFAPPEQNEKLFGLLVPSAIVPEQFNIVLNPVLEQIHSVSIKELRPLKPDPRLK